MKLLIIMIFLHLSLFAHPHFFIDVDVSIDKNKITHYWSFDKLNSKLLSFEFDENKDKIFQENEKIKFYNTHILKVKEYNFNLFLEANNKDYIFEKINEYDLVLNKRHVVFSFSKNVENIKQATLCNIDPTVYMAFNLKNVYTRFKTDIQKSQYDFCIGVQQ